MSSSFKDAFRKKGMAPVETVKPKVETKKWLNELPEDSPPGIPFDPPAQTKITERPKKK